MDATVTVDSTKGTVVGKDEVVSMSHVRRVKQPVNAVTDQESGKEEAEIKYELEAQQEDITTEVDAGDDFEYDLMLEPECVLVPVEMPHANANALVASRGYASGVDTVRKQKVYLEDTVDVSISNYMCGNCGITFQQEHSLNLHFKICQVQKSKSKPNDTSKDVYFCNICKKDIPKLSNFRVHQQIHSSERPYACEICNKGFKQAGTLKVHMRTHTGEKPYSCEECQKQFSQMSTLIKHKFQHTGEQPYTCDICQRKFTYLTNLKSHRRTHTGEKPYPCEICKKKYSTLREVKIHKLTHTGEKPHVCDLCNCGFRKLSTLKKHKELHMPEKYTCEICNTAFASLPYLKSHQRYTHGSVTVC